MQILFSFFEDCEGTSLDYGLFPEDGSRALPNNVKDEMKYNGHLGSIKLSDPD